MGKRGALVFKGESIKKKKKKSKHGKKETDPVPVPTSEASSRKPAPAPASSAAAAPPQLLQGTGQITTSGTVVMGVGTRFTKEIAVGDALVVGEEMRVVTMRLSDVSLNLSSGFQKKNYATPVSFRYIRKPRHQEDEDLAVAASAREKAAMEEQHAFGIYKGGGRAAAAATASASSSASSSTNELVYREKTEHGSYRIKRVKVDGSKDRADLLEMRTKKKSDKYC